MVPRIKKCLSFLRCLINREAISANSRTEPDRPDDDASARAPVRRAMVIAVPSAIAVMAPVTIIPAVVMASVVMAIVMTTAPISHQLRTALVLAQDAKAGRRRRSRCCRTADSSSQSQQTEKYETSHSKFPPSLIALPRRQNTRTPRARLNGEREVSIFCSNGTPEGITRPYL